MPQPNLRLVPTGVSQQENTSDAQGRLRDIVANAAANYEAHFDIKPANMLGGGGTAGITLLTGGIGGLGGIFHPFTATYETGPASGISMSEPTREEIDAKLAAVEARTETRFTELSGKIDRVADAVTRLTSDVTKELHEVKADNKRTRETIVVTAILGVVAAIAALWVTQANLLAAFTAGLTAK